MSTTVAELKAICYRAVNSTIGKNVLSLYALQFANYILPLIAVPYLVRVLGPEKFGAVAFGQSFMMYFVLLVNYGFDWSATRTISVQRDDPQKVSRTASAVLGAKVLLTVLSLGILTLLVAMVPKFQEVSALLYLLFGIVIGNALFPKWLFQGLERMVAISVINLFMRVLALAGIFLIIHQPADYLKYAGLLGFQWVGAGIVGLVWASLGLRVKPVIPALSEIVRVLKEGWILFLSQASVSLYTVGNAFILGLLTNPTVVGYYSAAEKIVKALTGLTEPVTQAAYPRFSKLAAESKASLLYWTRRALLLQSVVGFALSAVLFLGAPIIVDIVLGKQYLPAIPVIRVLAVVPFLVSISAGMGRFVFLPMRKENIRFAITFVAGFLNLFLAFILVPRWSGTGMAIAVVAAEANIGLLYWIYLSKIQANPFLPLVR